MNSLRRLTLPSRGEQSTDVLLWSPDSYSTSICFVSWRSQTDKFIRSTSSTKHRGLRFPASTSWELIDEYCKQDLRHPFSSVQPRPRTTHFFQWCVVWDRWQSYLMKITTRWYNELSPLTSTTLYFCHCTLKSLCGLGLVQLCAARGNKDQGGISNPVCCLKNISSLKSLFFIPSSWHALGFSVVYWMFKVGYHCGVLTDTGALMWTIILVPSQHRSSTLGHKQ